jgi:hypothetical protein
MVELGARAYYHNILKDIKLFVKNPLNLIDMLCIVTDLIVFAAFDPSSGQSHVTASRWLMSCFRLGP